MPSEVFTGPLYRGLPDYHERSMSAPVLVGAGTSALRIRGTAYPVLLPGLRDFPLHLAVVIVSLQVLGMVSLVTCAVLEVGGARRLVEQARSVDLRRHRREPRTP